jgi:hypothetical protein
MLLQNICKRNATKDILLTIFGLWKGLFGETGPSASIPDGSSRKFNNNNNNNNNNNLHKQIQYSSLSLSASQRGGMASPPLSLLRNGAGPFPRGTLPDPTDPQQTEQNVTYLKI